MRDVVVVGAGLAGARTCERLRAAGFTGRLVLLGAEPDPPYDRPPLTKDPDAEVDLRAAMGLDVFAAADEVRLGCVVSGLRAGPDGLEVRVADGTVLRAGAVVVATGAQPVARAGAAVGTGTGGPTDGGQPGAEPEVPPGEQPDRHPDVQPDRRPDVHVLHTRREAAGLWARVTPGVRLRVVGGGWVGCEAAATAAARGAVVELVEAQETLLAGRVPVAVAERVRRWLEGAGVTVITGRMAEPRAAVGGQAPDLVLLALGVRPATGWLAGSGVEMAPSGAVLTDPWGRSCLPGVFAVGDAAARWSPRYRAHLPGGHWTGALADPETVAPVVAAWAEPVPAPMGSSAEVSIATAAATADHRASDARTSDDAGLRRADLRSRMDRRPRTPGPGCPALRVLRHRRAHVARARPSRARRRPRGRLARHGRGVERVQRGRVGAAGRTVLVGAPAGSGRGPQGDAGPSARRAVGRSDGPGRPGRAPNGHVRAGVVMERWSYLAVMAFIFVGTAWLEFGLHTRVYQRWRRLVLTVLPVVVVFALWDIYAIAAGHWWFDEARITGWRLPGQLPIDEVVFFVMVPIACGADPRGGPLGDRADGRRRGRW